MGGIDAFISCILICMLTMVGVHALYLKSRYTAERRERLIGWIKIAVEAAEQVFGGSGIGREKLEFVKDWLYNNHSSIYEYFTQEDIDALIEAKVYETKR